MPNLSLKKNSSATIQPIVEQQELYSIRSWRNTAHLFPMGISPKINVMAQMEFELVYYAVVV